VSADINGLEPHEQATWLPAGDGLPAWLQELREQHLAAVDEYRKAVAGVLAVSAESAADARAWRRAVRDAVAEGRTPPEREHTATAEVGAARVEVAKEDAYVARLELAETCLTIIEAVRENRTEWDEYSRGASAEMRAAVGAAAVGASDEADRARAERRAQAEAEDAIVDLSDPFEKEASHAIA